MIQYGDRVCWLYDKNYTGESWGVAMRGLDIGSWVSVNNPRLTYKIVAAANPPRLNPDSKGLTIRVVFDYPTLGMDIQYVPLFDLFKHGDKNPRTNKILIDPKAPTSIKFITMKEPK